MPFDPVPPFDLVALEQEVLRQWREDDVFAESLRRREGAPEWVFYEGPPTANGRPGIHHVWARTFKDVYPRYHTMRGSYVARKGGWDCHGLPVEIEVEKELGFTSKRDIEEFGIGAFNQRCRESVFRYVEDWSALTTRIGMWLDTKDAYWTLTNDYIESVWWQFKQIWDAGDIYEGHKVVPYCGRCGTALSSHELGQPDAYRDITEPSVYVRFPVVDRDFDLLVWTTTPWTLVSNVAAAVGPAIPYVRVRGADGSRDLVLAAARVAEVVGDDADVVAEISPAELVGLRYERPFDFLALDDPHAPRVVADEFVTIDDGSGIVHLAPAFGEIDREVAERESLPMLNPVGPAATFVDPRVPFPNTFVKDADPALTDALARSGRLFRVVDSTHSYPHCWRCGTPLIYWAKPEWFARTTAHKRELLRENESIGWHPEYIKHGRFGDWLENNVDWALSRDRFWGTPLPVWRCDGCGADTCVGSVAELSELAGLDLSDLDLHRPGVDDVVINCPKCTAGRAWRVEPVLDVWFDSGAMPAAQFHYPFENEDVFAQRFPADFICEAIDQTRGWFYTLLAANTLVFGRSPYRNVVCLALLLDSEGRRMSTSRGTAIDPWKILDSRGADAIRWNFVSTSSPWTTKRVSETGIDESTRVLVTLWQTLKFFVTYANLDGWEPGGTTPAPTHVLDRWIRSRLHATVRSVTDSLDGFDALRAAQAIEGFVEDLSNWYVRRSRSRFWNADGSPDSAAHTTLHEALETVARLLAPMTPFLADALYATVSPDRGSVHLADWPDADDRALDPGLENEMARARAIVSLGLSARMEAKLKVRQPLRRALVLLPGAAAFSVDIAREVAEELNVKQLETVTSLEGLLAYSVVPNFRALGPKVGKRVPLVKDALTRIDGATVQRALDHDGRFALTLGDSSTVELTADDIEVRATSHEELALAQGDGCAVALDTVLDDELRAEGIARDVVRAVNDLRKELDFAIADRVRLRIATSGRVEAAAHRHRDWIARETLAVDLVVEGTAVGDGGPSSVVDGEQVRIDITRA